MFLKGMNYSNFKKCRPTKLHVTMPKVIMGNEVHGP